MCTKTREMLTASQCDRNQLVCGQCSRMDIPCPGYPDPLEQDYRDQSELVMKKAEASYKRGLRRVTMPTESAISCGPDVMTGALYHNPSLHLDTVAVTEFMATYIPQSPFDYLPAICTHQNSEASLNVSIRAVSLAMTASKFKDFRVLSLARQLYATALSDTNTALRNPEKAVQDSTLISVLLLGLFEALACQITGVSSNWAAHTRGALALLRLRGKEQFCSKLGRRLFDQMMSILTFDSMLLKAPVPPDLLKLVSIANLLHWESPKTSFARLIADITDSPCVLWDNDLLPSVKVAKAIWLDHKVSQYTRKLPSDYEYQEVHQDAQAPFSSGWETHGYTLHQYQHHYSARLWNACRVLRIMLNGVVHRTLREHSSPALSIHPELDSVQRRAAEKINDAATDICATVPQFLSPAKYDKIGIEASGEARVATLLAALSVVKAESLAPQTARSYAGDRLKYLGKKFKVPQAENAATGTGLNNVLHSGFHMLYVY
jgi:hypothetical protein